MRINYINEFISYKKKEINYIIENRKIEIINKSQEEKEMKEQVIHSELKNDNENIKIIVSDSDSDSESESVSVPDSGFESDSDIDEDIWSQFRTMIVSETETELEDVLEQPTTPPIVKDKILVIIACHTNSILRFNSLNLIMKYLLEIENIDIVIVNSTNLHLSQIVKRNYKDNCIQYFEIDNDTFYGFSKWHYGLVHVDYEKYSHVTFINDSFLLHDTINHFFELTRLKDVDLYGYNDSNQIQHHYQSYLFSIKKRAIKNFIKMFNENKNYVKSYMDAVRYYELRMFEYFPERDCFLKLTHFPSQTNKNIFFQNDFVYLRLRNSGVLPFTKLKRII